MSNNIATKENELLEKRKKNMRLLAIIIISIIVMAIIVGLFFIFMNNIGKTTEKELAWVKAFRLKCTVQQIYMILLLLPIFLLFIYPVIPMGKGKK